MPIDIYLIKFSPPCRAVLMTAKELAIDLNVKVVDLSEGQHLFEDYLKINPAHTVPSIDDNGFILWESRAIMQYLCNKYAPNSPLYPNDPKQRALVDRWLNFDVSLFSVVKDAIGKPHFTGKPATEQELKALNDSLKLLEQLIGDKKYLAADHLTIADLSVVATTSGLLRSAHDLSEVPNFKRWATELMASLPYYGEVNNFDQDEIVAFFGKMKASMAKNSERQF